MRAKWERFAEAHGCTRLKFPLFNTTRWFSRMECIDILTLNAHTLLLFLKKKKKGWPQAEAVYRQLSKNFLLCKLFLLRDMLSPCERLSKEFQSSSLMAHQIHDVLQEVKEELLMITTSKPGSLKGKRLSAFRSAVEGDAWVVVGK